MLYSFKVLALNIKQIGRERAPSRVTGRPLDARPGTQHRGNVILKCVRGVGASFLIEHQRGIGCQRFLPSRSDDPIKISCFRSEFANLLIWR